MEFLRRHQVLLASAFFLSASIVLLSLNRGSEQRVDPLGTLFLEAARPVQGVLTAVMARTGDLWDSYVDLVEVRAENERLRELVRALEGDHHRLEELKLENARLRELLALRKRISGEAITGRVIGRDTSEWFQVFTIDRGASDDVQAGQAVVCADGVVGRVIQSSPNASRVLLVSDHNSGVAALVQRSRARGILEGTLEGNALLKYVRRSDDVRVGDVVITSGLDGIFPKGLLLGRVSTVREEDHGLYQLAEVEPAVDFSKLEEVLVITSKAVAVEEDDTMGPAGVGKEAS